MTARAGERPIEVSPEEERFLRGFVRRALLPWVAGVGALAALALGAALAPLIHEPGPASAPQVPALLGDLTSIGERLKALELRQERKEQEHSALQQDVLARLYEIERAAQSDAAARLANRETNEQRIEHLEERLAQVERSTSQPAAPAALD